MSRAAVNPLELRARFRLWFPAHFVYQPVFEQVVQFVMAFPEEMTAALVYHQLFGLISPVVDVLRAADGEVSVSLPVD